jgi:hypothetical protein
LGGQAERVFRGLTNVDQTRIGCFATAHLSFWQNLLGKNSWSNTASHGFTWLLCLHKNKSACDLMRCSSLPTQVTHHLIPLPLSHHLQHLSFSVLTYVPHLSYSKSSTFNLVLRKQEIVLLPLNIHTTHNSHIILFLFLSLITINLCPSQSSHL